jgi:hypothetical protein
LRGWVERKGGRVLRILAGAAASRDTERRGKCDPSFARSLKARPNLVHNAAREPAVEREGKRHAEPSGARAWRLALRIQDLAVQLGDGLCLPERLAHEKYVGDEAERPDVCPRTDLPAAAQLLGCHVKRCAAPLR